MSTRHFQEQRDTLDTGLPAQVELEAARVTGAPQLFARYLAKTPLAHAIFRASELSSLADAVLSRPILDVGCGVGEFASIGLDAIVDVGLDRQACQAGKSRRSGLYRQVDCADARELPYADSSFQTVISISVLEHVPSPHRAINESFRVLGSGGKLLATVVLLDLHEHLFVPRLLRRCGLERLARLYTGFHDRVFRHVSLMSRGDWEAMLGDAGFIDIHTQYVVSPAIVKWHEALLWTALPYRLTMMCGWPLHWRPRWMTNWAARRFGRCLHVDEQAGGCLLIRATKP